MPHRLVVVSLGLLLLVVGGSSCSRHPAVGPDDRVTLVFKHSKHPRYAAFSELIQKFEAENPGIRVREEILPASTSAKIIPVR